MLTLFSIAAAQELHDHNVSNKFHSTYVHSEIGHEQGPSYRLLGPAIIAD